MFFTLCKPQTHIANPLNEARNFTVLVQDGVRGHIALALFQGNQAVLAGGAVYHSNARGAVRQSKFEGNSAEQDGGALYQLDTWSDVTLSTFAANAAGLCESAHVQQTSMCA